MDKGTLNALLFVHSRFLTTGFYQVYGILEAIRLSLGGLENIFTRGEMLDQSGIPKYLCSKNGHPSLSVRVPLSVIVLVYMSLCSNRITVTVKTVQEVFSDRRSTGKIRRCLMGSPGPSRAAADMICNEQDDQRAPHHSAVSNRALLVAPCAV